MPPQAQKTASGIRPAWPLGLQKWERKTNVPLMIMALVFVTAYATRVLLPDLPRAGTLALTFIDVGIWCVFVVEYLWRLKLAGHGRRIEYIIKTPLEAITVLLPPARPLRLLRATVLVLELYAKHTRLLMRTRMSVMVIGSTAILLFLASLAILDAERGAPESNIHDWGTSMWWAFATVTTVGYGDHFPVTAMGKIIAIVLMIIGIGLFGFVAATLASWITEKLRSLDNSIQEGQRSAEALDEQIRALRTEIQEIKEVLSSSNSASGVGAQHVPAITVEQEYQRDR